MKRKQANGTIFVGLLIITVGDLVSTQLGWRYIRPIHPGHLGLSVPNWSKPYSTDLELV